MTPHRFAIALLGAALLPALAFADELPVVRLDTDTGMIEVELSTGKLKAIDYMVTIEARQTLEAPALEAMRRSFAQLKGELRLTPNTGLSVRNPETYRQFHLDPEAHPAAAELRDALSTLYEDVYRAPRRPRRVTLETWLPEPGAKCFFEIGDDLQPKLTYRRGDESRPLDVAPLSSAELQQVKTLLQGLTGATPWGPQHEIPYEAEDFFLHVDDSPRTYSYTCRGSFAVPQAVHRLRVYLTKLLKARYSAGKATGQEGMLNAIQPN
jgi:hypothetical protein